MAVREPASPGRQLFAPRHLTVASGRSRPRLPGPCDAGPWCRTGPTTGDERPFVCADGGPATNARSAIGADAAAAQCASARLGVALQAPVQGHAEALPENLPSDLSPNPGGWVGLCGRPFSALSSCCLHVLGAESAWWKMSGICCAAWQVTRVENRVNISIVKNRSKLKKIPTQLGTFRQNLNKRDEW